MSSEFEALPRTDVLNIRKKGCVTSATYVNLIGDFETTHVIDFTGEGKTEKNMNEAIKDPKPFPVEVLRTRDRERIKAKLANDIPLRSH